MKSKPVELTIKGIALDEYTQMPVLILKAKESGLLMPLPVGPFEASAIIIEIQGIAPSRPLTHDIIVNFFKRHGFSMAGLEISGISENKYTARIEYTKGLKHFFMEVRPSDGIALALRFKAPIYSYDSVLAQHIEDQAILKNMETLSSEFLYLDSESSNAALM